MITKDQLVKYYESAVDVLNTIFKLAGHATIPDGDAILLVRTALNTLEDAITHHVDPATIRIELAELEDRLRLVDEKHDKDLAARFGHPETD